METRTSYLPLLAAALLCGCAGQPVPPLFFGEAVTVGINIAAGPASEGLDFSLGYKDRNIAIVPVSAVSAGKVQEIVASDGKISGRRDALSVFGQFKGTGETVGGKANVTLGRFFATGLAATSLAEAYREGWATPPSPTAAAPHAPKPALVAASPGPACSACSAQGVDSPPESRNKAYAPPLVFAQSNTLGIGVTTSMVTNQGGHFTLGYTDGDFALVPVMASNADGSLVRLGGRNQVDRGGNPVYNAGESLETDALSVFGQFGVTTETAAVHFGLNRFFTTGMAARNLAEGFKSVISRELQAPQAKAAALGQ